VTGTLFWRFALIGLLAFGGGAGLPLVERVAVHETRWIGERDFAAAVAFGQLTPGPVLVVATFIGYRAQGTAGAVAATLGVFSVPWFLATAAARPLRAAARRGCLRGFARGVQAASVGLLGVTALALARNAWAGPSPLNVAISAAALVLAAGTKVHPAWILLGGAAVGSVLGGSPLPGH
jgi:chromate transporter